MNDRELLELAAKACGWTAGFITNDAAPDVVLGVMVDTGDKIFGPWNPLTDDGDALRLAVKLNLSVDRFLSQGVWSGQQPNSMVHEFDYDDPYAATRRAIVRAAAEIGKLM